MAFVAPIVAAIGSFAGSASGILSLASTALGAGAAISQGNYQAAVAKNNAQIAEENAAKASEASQREQARSDREYAQAAGEQLAAQGASGFDVLGKTQLRTRAAQDAVGREQALDISNKGTSAARGLLQDAANFRAAGSQAKTQGYLTAAGKVLDFGAKATKGSSTNASLVGTKTKRMPWDTAPNWYGR